MYDDGTMAAGLLMLPTVYGRILSNHCVCVGSIDWIRRVRLLSDEWLVSARIFHFSLECHRRAIEWG